MKQRLVTAIAVLLVASAVLVAVPAHAESPACGSGDVLCYQPDAQALVDTINEVSEPSIAVPIWLQ